MKVFTFHTGGKYKASANALKESVESIGLECVVIERPDLGSWWKNCNQKCEVVLDALNTYGDEPIIWNDSDTRYLVYPELFDAIEEDFAAYYMTPSICIGGTLFFNGKTKAKRYVEAWVKNVQQNPTLEDDSINFRRALQSIKPQSIHHLPPSYCWNEKCMRSGFPHAKPVIAHEYQGAHDYPVITLEDDKVVPPSRRA